jgi:hypothetical protein
MDGSSDGETHPAAAMAVTVQQRLPDKLLFGFTASTTVQKRGSGDGDGDGDVRAVDVDNNVVWRAGPRRTMCCWAVVSDAGGGGRTGGRACNARARGGHAAAHVRCGAARCMRRDGREKAYGVVCGGEIEI